MNNIIMKNFLYIKIIPLSTKFVLVDLFWTILSLPFDLLFLIILITEYIIIEKLATAINEQIIDTITAFAFVIYE